MVRYGPKIGARRSAPLGEGDLDPHLTQCGHGQALPACQVSSWSMQLFGHSTPTAQTGQDRQERQWSDSTQQTVLQTVVQKVMSLFNTAQFFAYHVSQATATRHVYTSTRASLIWIQRYQKVFFSFFAPKMSLGTICHSTINTAEYERTNKNKSY